MVTVVIYSETVSFKCLGKMEGVGRNHVKLTRIREANLWSRVGDSQEEANVSQLQYV